MKHNLKITPEYFLAVTTGVKKFEVRKDDRNFQVGDYLNLQEHELGEYTGLYYVVKVTYILGRKENEKQYVAEGMVILGIEV